MNIKSSVSASLSVVRAATISLAALLSFGTGPAMAAYPDKPITVVVNSAVAGPVDLLARVLRDEMSRILGQNIVIDNRPAAGGVVGAAHVAQSAPDGYRLLVSGSGPMVLAPVLYKDTVTYKTLDAFRAINVSVDVPVFLAGTNEMPADNLKDYIAMVKKAPGKYSYGTAGIGTPAHLMSELFEKVAGIDLAFVPYKGSPEAMIGLTRGDVSVHVVTPAVALPLYDAGKIRLLAVSGTKRLGKAPKVPTFAESGLPEVVLPAWFGFFAPKGVPTEIIAKLDDAVRKALATPKAQEVLLGAHFNILSLGGAEGDRFLRSEAEKWSRFITDNNITVN